MTIMIPTPMTFLITTLTPFTPKQQEELDIYVLTLSQWQSQEAIIKQAITSTISDSLFLEMKKKKTVLEMWEAVKDQREKKSWKVTVDMQHKFQAKKCPESRDLWAHMNKLQAMHEDLALMGGSINDEDSYVTVFVETDNL
jgi:gag-polypeptide of LTR copia-type